MTTETYDFVSLVVKMILLRPKSVLSRQSVAKTQCFGHLSVNFTSQLINGISSNHQKLLRYFKSSAIVSFSRITLETVSPINVVLYLKDLTLLSSFVISLLKSAASSFE